MDTIKPVDIVYYLDHVIGHYVRGLLKPECGELVQDDSLIGNATGQDDIEGRDAVSNYDKQLVASHLIGIAHLPPMVKIRQVGLTQD
jgi:hypothetical protein